MGVGNKTASSSSTLTCTGGELNRGGVFSSDLTTVLTTGPQFSDLTSTRCACNRPRTSVGEVGSSLTVGVTSEKAVGVGVVTVVSYEGMASSDVSLSSSKSGSWGWPSVESCKDHSTSRNLHRLSHRVLLLHLCEPPGGIVVKR